MKQDRSLDDVCLEIYLGELPPVGYYGYSEDEVYYRLEKLVKVAREVNTGIWAKGWNREQALIGAGYEPEIIETIAHHEYAKGLDYNGC